ncbi:MAG: hypothetical protein PHZ21_04125 [Candidatus Bipolaricaulis sp.]|nr:hypothetical protein [Candidatus Bipolaricaulis sp.]
MAARKWGLTAEEYATVVEPFEDLPAQALASLIERLSGGNPITVEDLKRLSNLLTEAAKGTRLSLDDALEFYHLARKVQDELEQMDAYKKSSPAQRADMMVAFNKIVSFASFAVGNARREGTPSGAASAPAMR